MITVVYAAIVLGILIFVHELGHFVVARRCGVHVERFSIGFGPALFTYNRSGTEYCIAAIPFGGYVKMLGEDTLDEVAPEDYHRSFLFQHPLKKALIVAAGPICNFLLAAVLFFIVFVFAGLPKLMPEVGQVQPGSPAEKAGIKKGDVIVRINDITIDSWELLSETIKKWKPGDPPLTITVKRGQDIISIKVVPRVTEVKNIFGEPTIRPIIGITASGKILVERIGIIEALGQTIWQILYITKLFFLTIVKLIERVVPFKTVGGPILIAQMAKQQAQAGFFPFLNFIALISVNLGVLNLLPFPALDGGHLIVFLIEAVTGKRISQKTTEWIQRIGFALLIVLMIFVFYNDLLRVFPSIPDVFRGK